MKHLIFFLTLTYLVIGYTQVKQQRVVVDPKQSKGIKTKADLLYGRGWQDKFSRQYKSDPNNIQIASSYGHALMLSKQYDKAKNVLTKLLKSNPSHFESLKNLGLIHIALFNWNEAKKLFEKANKAQAQIKDPYFYLNFGKIYFNLKDQQNADFNFKKALSFPHNLNVKMELANFYKDYNQMGDAKEMYLDIIKQSPKAMLAHFKLGEIYISEGHKSKAKNHLKTFVELAEVRKLPKVRKDLEQAKYYLKTL